MNKEIKIEELNNFSKVVLCGKTGVGKDFLFKQIDLPPLVSTTTRPPRPQEVQGIDYNFVSITEFKQASWKKEFFEIRRYDVIENDKHNSWYYGTKLDQLMQPQWKAVLDLQGANKIKNAFSDVVIVYITAPYEIALARAKQRGGFEFAEFQRRWQSDREQFDKFNQIIDYYFDNSAERSNNG